MPDTCMIHPQFSGSDKHFHLYDKRDKILLSFNKFSEMFLCILNLSLGPVLKKEDLDTSTLYDLRHLYNFYMKFCRVTFPHHHVRPIPGFSPTRYCWWIGTQNKTAEVIDGLTSKRPHYTNGKYVYYVLDIDRKKVKQYKSQSEIKKALKVSAYVISRYLNSNRLIANKFIITTQEQEIERIFKNYKHRHLLNAVQ